MKKIMAIFLFLSMATAQGRQGVTWLSHEQGMAISEKNPEKPIFLFFSEDRCYITFEWLYGPFGKNTEIARLLEWNFINIKVDFLPFKENPLLEEYDIQHGKFYFIPTFIIMKGGKEVWRSCACMEEADLLKILRRYING